MNYVITYGTKAFNKLQSDVKKGDPLSCLVAATIGVGVVAKVSLNVYQWYRLRTLRRDHSLQSIVSKKKLREKLSEENPDSAWNEIVSLSSDELAVKLQKKELKALDVLRAYQTKALDIDGEINCVIEPIWEAEALALECDVAAKKGPLHGLPVSIKENYPIKGYTVSLGLSTNLDTLCLDDCVLVKVLKKQGAIPFVRTNVPQSLLSFQCSNPIYGMTVHPHDRSRSPGGSSGGEGALIASGGSIIGMGSDIGGSIRIPSHMCGICGLKTTNGRLSSRGQHPSGSSRPSIAAGYGPMARDVNGLVVVMQALLCPYLFQLDPKVPAIPFRNDIFESKQSLRIGYYVNDGFLQAAPACERAVEVAKGVLERLGHTLVPWCPPNVEHGITYCYKNAVTGDGGASLIKPLKYDKIDEAIAPIYFLLCIPLGIRRIMNFCLRPFSKALSNLFSIGLDLSTISEYWQFHQKVQQYREDVISHWQNNRLDAVICPGFSTPALPKDKRTVVTIVNYTALYNILDFTAGSLPVTRVTAEDDDKLNDYPCRDAIHKLVKKLSANSESLPVNVQCVTLPWQEELCLRVMMEIETALKGDAPSSPV
ncbi:fatty-acid amide hydrolase 1-like [Lineus longissimus]|uniref:fatty-acid amide hydrolase 1-like n=1 Tax=Lineus longissimus TaxID=88925 RepID=UPI002B4D857F